jgi:predicted HAD superfamily Cof-like phosphohydrolase
MTNVFKDQEKFMLAGDQVVDKCIDSQYSMYLELIKEEVGELQAAIEDEDKVEQLDALIDILVVTVGAIHSMGADAEGAWNEVMATNFAKIDPTTGKVFKREDGKILKPEGWKAPELEPFLTRG